jgi:adenylate cyclase
MSVLKLLFRKRVSFRIFLLELFLFLFVFYAVAMLAVSYLSTSQIINNTVVSYAHEYTDRVREQIKNHITEAAQPIRVVGSFLNTNEQYRDLSLNREFLWALMWPMMQQFPALHSIYIASEEGDFVQVRLFPELATRIIIRSQSPATEKWIYRNSDYESLDSTQTTPEYDHRERDWYKETGEIPRTYWSKPYQFSTDGEQGLTVSFPVIDIGGTINLVVAADISLAKISEFVQQNPVTENSISGAFDSSGRVIAGPGFLDADSDQNQAVWLQHIWPEIYESFQGFLENPQNVFKVHSKDDTADWLITFKPTGIMDWYAVTAIPQEDLTSQAMVTIKKMLLFSLAAFLVMIVLIYIMVSRVSRPLVKISEETNRLKQFDLEGIKPVSSKIAEIESVSHSLVTSVGALKAFRSYLPAELVRQLVEQGKGGELGGEKQELTIFFSDIANFTGVSERLDPQQLMLQLSEYFDVVTQLIMKEGGTVDKYIGDSIMAFWGAPVVVDTPAKKACHVALEAQKRIAKLNNRWEEEGKPRFETRIGLHTGEAIVGNVGSSERMNYSAIGDGVNLASRLEGLNKEFSTQIIISEATRLQILDWFQCRPLGDVKIKGKTKPVRVYELVSET